MNGLILCGGQSSRLGFDKLTIRKDGAPLYAWWLDALKPFCSKVFISCNERQKSLYDLEPALEDTEPFLGPLSGIMRLMQAEPPDAILVAACDLVYLGHADIRQLCESRNARKEATVMTDAEGRIFPLFSIVEPSIFKNLEDEYLFGKRSLLKVFNEANAEKIPSSMDFRGINTPEDYAGYLGAAST